MLELVWIVAFVGWFAAVAVTFQRGSKHWADHTCCQHGLDSKNRPVAVVVVPYIPRTFLPPRRDCSSRRDFPLCIHSVCLVVRKGWLGVVLPVAELLHLPAVVAGPVSPFAATLVQQVATLPSSVVRHCISVVGDSLRSLLLLLEDDFAVTLCCSCCC